MKFNSSSKDDNVPRPKAYIKEKWKNRELPKGSYVCPPLDPNEIKSRMGIESYFKMCRSIDTTAGMLKDLP